MWGKKNKETTKRDKRIVTCDVGTAQCEDEAIKCEKKINEPPNVTKVLSNMMLVLPNVTMEPSNVRKKKRELLNVTKVLLNVMLELHNVKMESSNVRKKKGNHQM